MSYTARGKLVVDWKEWDWPVISSQFWIFLPFPQQSDDACSERKGERSIPVALIDGIECHQFEAIPELPQPVDGKTINTRGTASFHLLEQRMIEFKEGDFSFDTFSFFIGEGFGFEILWGPGVATAVKKLLNCL